MLAAHTDPAHVKRMERLEREFPGDSFEVVAKEYIEKLRREGRAEATLGKIQWLLDFALPILGPLRVSEIRPIEVLSVLRGIERRGRYESARRLRSTIGAVCRYAVATARAETDPTAALAALLQRPRQHHGRPLPTQRRSARFCAQSMALMASRQPARP
jgi:hypothetical protein